MAPSPCPQAFSWLFSAWGHLSRSSLAEPVLQNKEEKAAEARNGLAGLEKIWGLEMAILQGCCGSEGAEHRGTAPPVR